MHNPYIIVFKIKESVQSINKTDDGNQLHIFLTHVIIERLTRNSACLIKHMSEDAEKYLKSDCLYNEVEIVNLKRKISRLED